MAADKKKLGGKDLTVSQIDRQNILNNPYAIREIEKAAQIRGIPFEGKTVVLKEQVAAFFEINLRTAENYLSKNSEELARNGYEIIRGKRLKEFKLRIVENDVPETDFGNISKTPQLGIFDFRAFLNMAMLLTKSEPARLLRHAILDIVIDTINIRTGGGTKYINQRDEDFIVAYFQGENYRRVFTDALRDCVDMGNFKYPLFTDKIYVSIFNEDAREYRKVLRLHAQDKVRDTFYSEIIDLIASYEYGFGELLREVSTREDRRLDAVEVDELFRVFEKQAHWKPLIDSARKKMASRDLAFRDALHQQLSEYIAPINRDEFERFLGEKSKELAERLEEAKDVMKRLKECE
ncbi:MAG: DNA-binding protein [Pontiella sp.]